MRRWIGVLLGCFTVTPLLAQDVQRPSELDSGTVVRFRWPEGREKARLLASLRGDWGVVRYCRYPSPVCGEATRNPPRVRSVGTWRASRCGGALARHGGR